MTQFGLMFAESALSSSQTLEITCLRVPFLGLNVEMGKATVHV
jgi:hypothetical protein